MAVAIKNQFLLRTQHCSDSLILQCYFTRIVVCMTTQAFRDNKEAHTSCGDSVVLSSLCICEICLKMSSAADSERRLNGGVTFRCERVRGMLLPLWLRNKEGVCKCFHAKDNCLDNTFPSSSQARPPLHFSFTPHPTVESWEFLKGRGRLIVESRWWSIIIPEGNWLL